MVLNSVMCTTKTSLAERCYKIIVSELMIKYCISILFCLLSLVNLQAQHVEKAPYQEAWSRQLHVKTNAIGLAAGIANMAVEIDLAKHWSFTLPVYYSAWDYFKPTLKFRTLAVQPEFRYWFKEQNEGWFIGAHFGLGYYNYALDGDYRYQDHNRETPSLGGGLAFGYRTHLSKNKRWKMEFSLGGGVYDSCYDKFHNTTDSKDGLMVESSIKKTYWGLDQASISIAYSFDLKKKGGRR